MEKSVFFKCFLDYYFRRGGGGGGDVIFYLVKLGVKNKFLYENLQESYKHVIWLGKCIETQHVVKEWIKFVHWKNTCGLKIFYILNSSHRIKELFYGAIKSLTSTSYCGWSLRNNLMKQRHTPSIRTKIRVVQLNFE